MMICHQWITIIWEGVKIVAKLEEGNIDLDDSIKSFEEGVMLVKECPKQLSEAELKVEKLLDSGDSELLED